VPSYHGWHLALSIVLPALAVAALWGVVSPGLVETSFLQTPAARALPAAPMVRASVYAEASAIADDPHLGAFNPVSAELAPALGAVKQHFAVIGALLVVVAAFGGGAYGYTRVRAGFPARTRIERGLMLLLLLASLLAVLTTLGIVLSLVFESARFFAQVSPLAFLTGLRWAPGSALPPDLDRAFGAVPLFWGTLYIGAVIAMAVAIPLGLMSAIYLTQYADRRARRAIKPILEILAGVPTVVYGYFAALTVAPIVRDFAARLGESNASSESALAAGLVMGVMIIPFVSSMADDSLAAVPAAMRDGSLAMGATRSETIRKVLLPAALPGIVAGVILAVSRAIGETMIVVMAAGATARLSADPFASMTTVTYQIVQLLTGDQEFDSPKTLSAFALGLVLFLVTFVLNIVALRVVRRFREAYE
jgi:phosphate transport system permease protein